MDDCGYQRQEEYHQDLGMDAFADLFPGKSDFLHDLEPSGILQSFGDLFVIDDQDRSSQEYNGQEDADKEDATIE